MRSNCQNKDMMKTPAKKIAGILAAAAFCVLTWAGFASGVTIEREEDVHISNLHRIDDDLYAWASTVTVDGLVEGDLIAGAYDVKTNGHIRGSVNVMGFRYRHTGEIDGGLRAFVNECEIDGYVGRSVVVAANELRIGEKGIIEKEAVLYGNKINFQGYIKENLKIEASTTIVSGTVNGNVNVQADEIKVIAPAVIKGDFTYVSQNEAQIELDSGVIILGETVWQLPEEKDGDEDVGALTVIIINFSKMLAAFLFGVILISLFRKYAQESLTQLRDRPAVATATGFLSLIIYTLSVIVLLISAVLILIGVTLISGDSAAAGVPILSLSILMVPITSFITVSGGVLFYSGKIVIALLVGFLIFKLIRPQAPYLSKLQLFLGLIVVTLIFSIPYIGFIVYVIASIIGGGAIILGIKYCRKESESKPQLISNEPEEGKDPPGAV